LKLLNKLKKQIYFPEIVQRASCGRIMKNPRSQFCNSSRGNIPSRRELISNGYHHWMLLTWHVWAVSYAFKVSFFQAEIYGRTTTALNLTDVL